MRHLRLFSFNVTVPVIGLAVVLLSAQMALAQAGSASGASRAWSGVATAASGSRPVKAGSAASGTAVTRTGEPGFAQRVGTTVALPPSPGVVLPPGVGNINRPGVAPAVV